MALFCRPYLTSTASAGIRYQALVSDSGRKHLDLEMSTGVCTWRCFVTDDRFPGLIALLLEGDSGLPRVSLKTAAWIE